ncbi:hypothetical protein CW304_30875 [Bacillus sp. UFRGS-B20]|nr:hypothetical protein CW304_30875 [Bacillus sp. UFRGS-B20]
MFTIVMSPVIWCVVCPCVFQNVTNMCSHVTVHIFPRSFSSIPTQGFSKHYSPTFISNIVTLISPVPDSCHSGCKMRYKTNRLRWAL